MENKKVKITVSVLLAIAIAAFAFVAGFFTERCAADRAVASYEWGLKTIKDNYYFCEPDETFTETSLKTIAEKYLDQYSEYYTKEEYAEVMKSNEGSKSGIGISYSFVDGRGVYISKVVGNSPAYGRNTKDAEKGLRSGEWIKSGSLENQNEVQFTTSQKFSDFISSAADGVKINLTAEDGTVYTMSKAQYTASYTSFSTSSTGWTFHDSATGGLALYEEANLGMPYLPDGCAYLRLDQFYGTATKEFYSLIEKFNAMNCTSLILDLRSNGGGYVSVMQDIAGAFADGKSKLAMLSRDKKGREEKYDCKKISDSKKRVSKDVKVFVLANAGTASASEALIGAMVCYGALEYENIFLSQYSDEYISWRYKNETVKNAQTYGKGIMQTPFTNYRTGEVLKLTTAKIYWPDKVTSIHDRGVTVKDDKCTAVPAEWEWTKGDDELKAAVEMIKTRL